MKKLVAWMMVCSILLTGLSALAEGETQPTQGNETTQVVELKYGDNGDAVAQLQTRLTELEYYSGKISGKYREGTQAAIRGFQEDFGLGVTGIADAQTQEQLYSAKYHPMKKGDTGEDVKTLQSRLTELGYYNGKISGKYLEGTYYAIHSFQNVNGLTVTGEADVKTLELLYDVEKALPIKTATPTPAPAPTPTPVINTAEQVTAGDTAANASLNVEFSKKLQRGSTGSKVKQLQTRLTELGFYTGPISGNFMNQTRDAVKAFQQHNAITVDGIVGEETWNMIFNSQDVSDASATPKPTPVPTPIPYAVTVDVKNQVVTVYGRDDNGGYTNVVRQMICSSGTTSHPSDLGDWTLNGATARWATFPKWGGGWAQYWTRINSGIAFHSVLYNTTNTMALATGSYYDLGSRASHGCIRLQVSDAKWVYENLGKGVVVTITDKLPSDPELTQSLKPAPLDRSRMLPKETPAPTAPPVYNGSEMPPSPLRTLKKGVSGADVYWLQMKLTELGYYNGTVTGGYYGGTVNAVKAYQKDNGLKADGIAGEVTQNTIYASVLATPAPAATPEPSPTADPNSVPAN
jgi:peptidoglycan hydrolase-like protein with peptidoglycan-binding domain